jgi:hypothetical protein
MSWSGQRESNPHVQHGKLAGYHYIMPALCAAAISAAPSRRSIVSPATG